MNSISAIPPDRTPSGEKQNSLMAVLCLVFGILSFPFCCGIVFGIPALVLGFIELKAIREGRSDPSNRTYVIIGMILGGTGCAVHLLLVIFHLGFLSLIKIMDYLDKAGTKP